MELLLAAVSVLLLAGVIGGALLVRQALIDVRVVTARIASALEADRPAPRIIRLPAETPDMSGVDFDVAQPAGTGQHDHVWSAQPFEQDSWSKSFRCQVPRCSRVHTQMVR